jgi:ribosomal protein RSM22 (predicted rRNA methylase)
MSDGVPLALPAAFVEIADQFLRERFPQATPRKIAGDVQRMSDAFTADREELPGSYLNHPPSRSAYLAFFHPQQTLRAMAALAETRARAAERGLWPGGAGQETLRVLDLGAGLGAMSWALLTSGDLPPKLEFTLVDHQRSALADARDLLLRVAATVRPGAPPPMVRTAPSHLVPWLDRAAESGWRYDVALRGGVLNEMKPPWDGVVARVLSLLDGPAPGCGLMLVLEPALPPVARNLAAARDELLDVTTTIAPCTHGRACPLLKLRKDWCFTVRPASLPPFVREQARRLGHQTEEVRYAFWAAVPRPAAAAPEHPEDRHGRVVSDPVLGGQVMCVAGERERRDERAAPLVRGTLIRR